MAPTRPKRVGVIGAARPSARGLEMARRVGELLAAEGAVVVCGGLGGIMEAACEGAARGGGVTIGILPGNAAADANRFVTLPIVTNMGHARNVIIAQTAEVLIAIEGEFGTLSEIAIGLKCGRRVIGLGSWNDVPGVESAADPESAVALAMTILHMTEGG